MDAQTAKAQERVTNAKKVSTWLILKKVDKSVRSAINTAKPVPLMRSVTFARTPTARNAQF